MLKIFRLLIFAAIFFFAASESIFAAPVNISNDNLKTFIEKCNVILKTSDPENFLDTPTFLDTESGGLNDYVDNTIKTESGAPITITYTLKDDKIYAIMLESDKYDENVKKYFDGLSIIFLKSLGLTDGEIKDLLSEKIETFWQRENFISRFEKNFIVSFYSPTLLIIAEEN